MRRVTRCSAKSTRSINNWQNDTSEQVSILLQRLIIYILSSLMQLTLIKGLTGYGQSSHDICGFVYDLFLTESMRVTLLESFIQIGSYFFKLSGFRVFNLFYTVNKCTLRFLNYCSDNLHCLYTIFLLVCCI